MESRLLISDDAAGGGRRSAEAVDSAADVGEFDPIEAEQLPAATNASADQTDSLVLRIDPSLERGLGRYGLEQLLRAAGVRYEVCGRDGPHIYYGNDPDVGRAAVLWIPAARGAVFRRAARASSTGQAVGSAARTSGSGIVDEWSAQRTLPACLRDAQPGAGAAGSSLAGQSAHGESGADTAGAVGKLRVCSVEDLPVVHDGPRPERLFVGNRLSFDIARATAYWLTLEGEHQIADRDRHGRVPASATVLAGGGWLEKPPIQLYASLLVERLASVVPRRAWLDRWPNRGQYAVVLTHDVDAPELPNRYRALFKELFGGGQRPRRQTYWDIRARIRARGWSEAFRPATLRREWDFDRFCGIEEECGLRSAFYFAAVHREHGHPCDVSYEPSRHRYRRLFRRLNAGDWEIGLHAAYLTCRDRPSVRAQLERLRGLLGYDIEGVRHHYLQLDQEDPIRSLLAQDAEGVLYDSSVGFNDCAGFRAGTVLPFQPYDAATGEATRLVELPMSIADMHLPREDETAAVGAVLDHLRLVRSLGGLAVLNWHVGHWHSDPVWRTAFRTACEWLAQDRDVWVGTPREVARWWRSRSQMAARDEAVAPEIGSSEQLSAADTYMESNP